jgi:hypothetical protein
MGLVGEPPRSITAEEEEGTNKAQPRGRAYHCIQYASSAWVAIAQVCSLKDGKHAPRLPIGSQRVGEAVHTVMVWCMGGCLVAIV